MNYIIPYIPIKEKHYQRIKINKKKVKGKRKINIKKNNKKIIKKIYKN